MFRSKSFLLTLFFVFGLSVGVGGMSPTVVFSGSSQGWVFFSVGWAVFLAGSIGVVRQTRGRRLVLASSLFVLSGLATGLSFAFPRPDDLSRWASRQAALPVTLTGRVANSLVVGDSVRSFDLAADSICYLNTCRHVTGTSYVPTGRFPLSVKTGYRDRSTIRFRGWLTPPIASGTFDQASWLRQRSVFSVVESFPHSFSVIRRTRSRSPLSILRRNIIQRINETHTDPGTRGLLRAMITGDRTGLEKGVRSSFQAAGAAHLLAVSGLHVGIIAFICYAFVTAILTRMKIVYSFVRGLRLLTVLFGLGLFSTIAGAGSSVIRGSVMAAVYLIQYDREQSSSSWDVLALSALGLLAIDPVSLFSAGFQLSYVAVIAIILSAERSDRKKKNGHPLGWSAWRWIGRSFLVSGYIIAATAPIVYAHFGRVFFAGIVTNLITIPFFGLFFVSGICSTILGSIGHIALVTDILGRAFLKTVSSLSLLSVHTHIMGSFLSWWLALVMCIAVITLLDRYPKQRKKVALVVLGSVLFWYSSRTGKSTVLSGTVIAVGQGDASVIRFPSGRTLLVDAGPGPASTDQILGQMATLGTNKLDTVIITHPHRDHTGGLLSLVNRVPIGRAIFAAGTEGLFIRALSEHSVRTRLVVAGDTVMVSPDAYLAVLGPSSHPPSTGQSAHMLVMMIRYGCISLLFPGDLEFSGERRLIASYGSLLSADLIKVAHHGSRTSSSTSFIGRSVLSGKTWSVVSVGKGNPFGHPDADVIRRWTAGHARIWITSRWSSFSFRSDGNTVVPDAIPPFINQ